MSGNTKFTGFLSGNRVQLERWGVQVVVQLDPGAVEALRKACFYDLPGNIAQRGTTFPTDFRAVYDADEQRVHVDLSPEAAAFLGNLLVDVNKSAPQVQPVLQWSEDLKSAVQLHEASSEPGVKQ